MKLPRNIHRLKDGTGRFWVYTTRNSRPVRNIVSWPLLKKLRVPIPEGTQALQPGLALAKKALVKLQGVRLSEERDGAISSQKKVRVVDLLKLVEADYVNNDFRSWSDALGRWNHHLRAPFGDLLANEITSDRLNGYVAKRLGDGARPGSINRELSLLRRAVKLGHIAGKVSSVISFPHLSEASGIRTGFLTQSELNRLAAAATDMGFRALIVVASNFGFRRGECLDLRVRQVDLVNNVIELERKQTKNGEIKIVAMTAMVRNALAACVAGKQPNDHVFSWADGRPIRDFRQSWSALLKKAGITRKVLFHDLRRSAIKRMVELGIPERTAMTISGHRTRSVFDRYAIQDLSNLREAARKISAGAVETTTNTESPDEQREPEGGVIQ